MAHLTRITKDDAARGIYFDYEGNEESAPTILGWGYGGAACHVIVEPGLEPLTELTNPKHIVRTASLEEALAEMVVVAKSEGRMVFGFTRHEVNQTTTYCKDRDVVAWMGESYVNAKPYIDRWVSHLVQTGDLEQPQDKSLQTRMPLVGMAYTAGRGPGIAGPGLTRLRAQLERYGEASLMTPGAKRHWWRIVGHNATDVRATRELTIAAVNHLYG